jgi:hypothetical protein
MVADNVRGGGYNPAAVGERDVSIYKVVTSGRGIPPQSGNRFVA